MMERPTSSTRWRERGNRQFDLAKQSNQQEQQSLYEKSIRCYTKALEEAEDDDLKASAAKNMAKAQYDMAVWKRRNAPLITQTILSEVDVLYRDATKNFTLSLNIGTNIELSRFHWRSNLRTDLSGCVTSAIKNIDEFKEHKKKVASLTKLSECLSDKKLKLSCHTKQAQILYNAGVHALDLDDSNRALDYFRECHRPIEEIRRHDNANKDLQELVKNLKKKTRNAEGKQIIQSGVGLLEKAGEEKKQGKSGTEHIFGAMDAFREAIAVTAEKDLEIEAACLSHLGRIYEELLDLHDKAKEYFMRCIQLTVAMPDQSFALQAWYSTCTKMLAKYQNTVVKKEEESRRDIIKASLQKEMDILDGGREKYRNDIPGHLQYIYQKFPLTKRSYTLPDEVELRTKSSEELKSITKKIVVDYHSDKQRINDKKTKILNEEITKALNNIMERLKC